LPQDVAGLTALLHASIVAQNDVIRSAKMQLEHFNHREAELIQAQQDADVKLLEAQRDADVKLLEAQRDADAKLLEAQRCRCKTDGSTTCRRRAYQACSNKSS
jgi:regulator of protease activity HflC (stomatin/prohibitin superfamily)